MSQSSTIAFGLLAGFVVYITVRGELPAYLCVIGLGSGCPTPPSTPAAPVTTSTSTSNSPSNSNIYFPPTTGFSGSNTPPIPGSFPGSPGAPKSCGSGETPTYDANGNQVGCSSTGIGFGGCPVGQEDDGSGNCVTIGSGGSGSNGCDPGDQNCTGGGSGGSGGGSGTDICYLDPELCLGYGGDEGAGV